MKLTVVRVFYILLRRIKLNTNDNLSSISESEKTNSKLKQQFLGILKRLPAIFVMCVSWYLSSQERLNIPSFKNSDKIVHFFCFGFLAFCWTFWFANEKWNKENVHSPLGHSVLVHSAFMRRILIVVAIVSTYGIIDEIHQSFVPGRSCSVFDWVADTLGAGMGTGFRIFCTSVVAKRMHR